MNKVVPKLVALGVPGLVLVVVVSWTGLAGAAAFTAGLAALGGPFGMMGGLALLGVIGLTADAIAEFGMERLFSEVVRGLQAKGKSKAQIRREVEGYPITRSLKDKILSQL